VEFPWSGAIPNSISPVAARWWGPAFAAVVALIGIVLVRLGKERFEALDRRFDGVESQIGDV
jgi:hypothetical protein